MATLSPRPLTIGIVAGDVSGDQLGAHLMRALLAKRRDLRFVGIGGSKMEAAGAELLFPMEEIAVGGYVETLRHRREISRVRKRMREHFRNAPPALFIGVDATEFNLDLEIDLKKSGIPTVQYGGPAVWASRRERVHKVRAAASLLLTVFPFEARHYDKSGVPVRYVGHPLADLLAELPTMEAVREELRVPDGVPVIALLPGSRAGEVEHMAEIFVRAAVKLSEDLPEARFLVPFATRDSKLLFEAALARVRPENLILKMLIGHSLEAMAAADIVLVASGTAALEAALLKRPMVIAYRTDRFSWWLLKRRAYLPYVGLPNILAGESIVPELLQDEATPSMLAAALLGLMYDSTARANLDSHFEAMRSALRQNTEEKAAAAILPLLGRLRVS